MNATDEAARWFIAQRTGELSAEEAESFARWLGDSAANVREYLAVAELWGALPAAPSVQAASLDDEREALRSAADVTALSSASSAATARAGNVANVAAGGMATSPAATPVETTKKKRPSAAAMALAASVLIMIAAGVTVWMAHVHGNEITTRRGEQRSVGLADGSVVQVNALSQVNIDYDSHVRRIQFQEGEALFHVAKDASRPFEVITPDVTVRVLGTTFNVYRRAGETRVAVVEGKVQVLTRSGAVALTANEKASVERHGENMSKSQVAAQTATAWTQRRLIFDEEPLSEVARQFNLYNARQLSVEGELSDFHINGVFDADDPGALIAYLQQVQRVEVEEKNNGIHLRRSGPH